LEKLPSAEVFTIAGIPELRGRRGERLDTLFPDAKFNDVLIPGCRQRLYPHGETVTALCLTYLFWQTTLSKNLSVQ
jgi:hypothetical protein